MDTTPLVGSIWSGNLTDWFLELASIVLAWLIMRALIRRRNAPADQSKALRVITLVFGATLILSTGFDFLVHGFEAQVALVSVLFVIFLFVLIAVPEMRRHAGRFLGFFYILLICVGFALFALFVLPRFVGERAFYWVSMVFAVTMILVCAYMIYRSIRAWSRKE